MIKKAFTIILCATACAAMADFKELEWGYAAAKTRADEAKARGEFVFKGFYMGMPYIDAYLNWRIYEKNAPTNISIDNDGNIFLLKMNSAQMLNMFELPADTSAEKFIKLFSEAYKLKGFSTKHDNSTTSGTMFSESDIQSKDFTTYTHESPNGFKIEIFSVKTKTYSNNPFVNNQIGNVSWEFVITRTKTQKDTLSKFN